MSGDRPLAAQFSDLFNCVAEKHARVKAYMTTVGGQVVWCPIFRRNLKDHEVPQLLLLLDLLMGFLMVDI